MTDLVAEVHAKEKLLKQPPSFTFGECTVMCSVVSLNEVDQVTTRCILTDNAQVVRGEEDFLELNDVGVRAA